MRIACAKRGRFACAALGLGGSSGRWLRAGLPSANETSLALGERRASEGNLNVCDFAAKVQTSQAFAT